jgi:hypothetical protein
MKHRRKRDRVATYRSGVGLVLINSSPREGPNEMLGTTVPKICIAPTGGTAHPIWDAARKAAFGFARDRMRVEWAEGLDRLDRPHEGLARGRDPRRRAARMPRGAARAVNAASAVCSAALRAAGDRAAFRSLLAASGRRAFRLRFRRPAARRTKGMNRHTPSRLALVSFQCSPDVLYDSRNSTGAHVVVGLAIQIF